MNKFSGKAGVWDVFYVIMVTLLALALGGCGNMEDQTVIEAAMDSAEQAVSEAIDTVAEQAADAVDAAGEMANEAAGEIDAAVPQ